jgi:hypothetical protein
MVTLLTENGANIDATDATGKNVLIDAIQSGNIKIVSYLVKNGASPHIQEMYGRNAFHEVALTGNKEMITLIQKAGGNPLARDTQGITPFSIVIPLPACTTPRLLEVAAGIDIVPSEATLTLAPILTPPRTELVAFGRM